MSANRAGREPKKTKPRALKRLEIAVERGRKNDFDQALQDCLAGKTPNWQQRALGMIMESTEHEAGAYFMDRLMSCAAAPRPSEKENFLGLAVLEVGRAWTVEPLMAAGFKIKSTAVNKIDPMGRLAYLVCTGQMAMAYLPVLAQALPLKPFQDRISMFMLSLALDGPDVRAGCGFLSVSNANMLSEAFAVLSTEDAAEISQVLSRAFGGAIKQKHNINPADVSDPFAWQQGYDILRQAGVLDPQAVLDGTSVGGGVHAVAARVFINTLDAKILASRMQGHTPKAQDPTKALRF